VSYKETTGKKPYQLIPELVLRALDDDNIQAHYKDEINEEIFIYWRDLEGESFIDIVLPVLEFGIEKYGQANSWKQVPNAQDEYSGALIRHKIAVREGGIDSKAEDSGLYHMQHILCNLMFLLWFELQERMQGVRYGRVEWHK